MADYPDFDLYAELEVSPKASNLVIQAAYRRLSRKYHPDSAARFCSECNAVLADDAMFCSACGTEAGTSDSKRITRLNQAFDILGKPASRADYDSWREGTRDETGSISSQPREFNRLVAAARMAFNKYGDFRGRSSRPQFWYWVLFTFLVDVAFTLSGILLPAAYELLSLIQLVWGLVILVPHIAVGARRLHDTNRSGWKQLWVLTIVGVLYVIYLLVQPSDEEQNDHGPQPDW